MGLNEMKDAATWPVILIGITASMGGFMFGSDTGQLSGYIIMENFMNRFAQTGKNGEKEWSNTRLGLVVGMLSIGCLFGALLAGPLGDRIGRRKAIMTLCGVFAIGNSIFISAYQAWYQIIIARFISGLAVGGCSTLVPVYVSETVPKEVRGMLVSMYQLFVTLGLLTSYCINLGTSTLGNQSAQWRAPIGIGYTWAILLAIGMMFLPESPRWLLSHGHPEECARAIRFINKTDVTGDETRFQREYDDIEKNVHEAAQAGQASWGEVFSPRGKALYRTLLGYGLQVGQQLTGANYFFYFGAKIFSSVGIENSFVTQIILGIVNVVCTFPGLYFIERFGRRKPLIFGGIWQFCWLMVFSSVGSQLDPSDKKVGSVMIFSACMFIASFASTWGTGVWVAMGEMYPLRLRSNSASVATTGNWLFNFLLAFLTPVITDKIGYNYGYVFAVCNAMAVAMVFFFYYESANLTLEHVDIMYNDPKCKPWNSISWIAPGTAYRGGPTVDEAALKKAVIGSQNGSSSISTGTEHKSDANLNL